MSNELARAGTNASVKFTSETLPEVHQLVVELRDVTASLRRIGSQLKEIPASCCTANRQKTRARRIASSMGMLNVTNEHWRNPYRTLQVLTSALLLAGCTGFL